MVFHNVQNQRNAVDCGLFSIVFAVSLSFGKVPSTISYDESKLRSHLHEMLVNNVYGEFPYMSDSIGRESISKNQQYRRR